MDELPEGPAAPTSPISATVERWASAEFTDALRGAFWMGSPVVQGILNRRATGEATVDWLTWLGDELIAPRLGAAGRPRRVLVLGCGDGWVERALAARFPLLELEAQDLAPALVERCRSAATAAGLRNIRYLASDLNEAPWPEERYDLVVAHAVIHHVERLEHLFAGIRRGLVDDGALVVNEYVGPDRLQYTDLQLGLVNEVLAALPRELCWGALSGVHFARRERPDRDTLRRQDPSESARSSEIPALLGRAFEIVLDRPLGGTLLGPLLHEIVANFEFARPRDTALLGLIAFLEELLLERQVLPSDYRLLIGTKRSGGARPSFAAPRPRDVRALGLPLLPPCGLCPVSGGPPASVQSDLLQRLANHLSPLFALQVDSAARRAAPPDRASLPTAGWFQRALQPWLDQLGPDRFDLEPLAAIVARVAEQGAIRGPVRGGSGAASGG